MAFLVCGFVIGTAQPVSFAPSASDFTHIVSAPFAISLVFVMYSFSGWNAATYIIGEVRLPERNVPRAMLIGTLIVLVLYVALNAVFLHTAPIDKLAGQLDVARISGSYIFGEFGGRIVGAMICFGLISSISAMMWIGPRVMMTMGEDIPVLRAFARRSTGGAPAYAILFQLTVASLMLFTRSFEAVLDFIQFALLFCSFFTVLGVIKLRITHPDLPRPYRAWGYPVTPVVFLLVTGLHDVLSFDRTAVAVAAESSDHVFRSVDLRRFPQAGRSRPRGRIVGSRMNMLRSVRMATLAAVMLFGGGASVRAQTASADDTAKFLAGMMPSADSPLTPLTKEAAWQRHAKFFDTAFEQTRAAPDIADPRLGGYQSGGAEADHVLHVLRSGLSLCERVLFQGVDLCAERARAGRLGA